MDFLSLILASADWSIERELKFCPIFTIEVHYHMSLDNLLAGRQWRGTLIIPTNHFSNVHLVIWIELEEILKNSFVCISHSTVYYWVVTNSIFGRRHSQTLSSKLSLSVHMWIKDQHCIYFIFQQLLILLQNRSDQFPNSSRFVFYFHLRHF